MHSLTAPLEPHFPAKQCVIREAVKLSLLTPSAIMAPLITSIGCSGEFWVLTPIMEQDVILDLFPQILICTKYELQAGDMLFTANI